MGLAVIEQKEAVKDTQMPVVYAFTQDDIEALEEAVLSLWDGEGYRYVVWDKHNEIGDELSFMPRANYILGNPERMLEELGYNTMAEFLVDQI